MPTLPTVYVALAVGVRLSGGTAFEQYTITAEITTTQGNQFSRSIVVPVSQR